jgi:hypothetical protein
MGTGNDQSQFWVRFFFFISVIYMATLRFIGWHWATQLHRLKKKPIGHKKSVHLHAAFPIFAAEICTRKTIARLSRFTRLSQAPLLAPVTELDAQGAANLGTTITPSRHVASGKQNPSMR